jgi:hypothetical protein
LKNDKEKNMRAQRRTIIILAFFSAHIAMNIGLNGFTAQAQLSPEAEKPAPVDSREALPPDKAEAVRAARFQSPPTIDGKLDEQAWQQAAVLKNFYQTQPGDNVAPSYPTVAMLGYDDKRLYVGVRAANDPERIRATMTKRDDVTNDDYVAIYLDTFNDRRTAYVLMVNPLGIQQDGIFSEGSEVDYSVDVVMESKGVLSDDGYTIEMAVPFSSLKYEAGKEKFWGIHILRQIKSLDEENSWMPLRRDRAGTNKTGIKETRARFLAQAGHLTGFENIATERTLEIIPTFALSETGKRVRAAPVSSAETDPGRWHDQYARPEPGFSAKIRVTPGISLDAAVNPDFGEVEADQPQITANQRFPLFFEEKRPFFLEGIDLFRTPIQAVHTRTIIDPDVAMKLSGKRGRTSFGLMLASDDAPGNFSEEERNDPALRPGIEKFLGKNARSGVLRIRRDVGHQSNVGMIAASYDFVERHNRLAGIDGRLSLGLQTSFNLQLAGASSRRFFYDPKADQNRYRSGNGFGYFTELIKTGRHLSLQVAGEGYSPDYRADLGYTLRTDMNRFSVFARYNSEPKPNSKLISWSVLYTFLTQFDWEGRRQYGYHYPRLLLNFKRQTFVNFHMYRDFMRLFEEEFGPQRTATRPGAFAGEPERSTVYRGVVIEAGTSPSKKYSFSFNIDNAWDYFDFDFGAGPKFPRVSPAALADPNAPLDPGPGKSLNMTASATYQPADGLRIAFDYTKSRLVRNDNKRVAFDQNLYSLRANYYFTRFTFGRMRIDYDTMIANVRGQFLLGWTPNPGTALYLGYNDDLNYDGYNSFTNRFEPGWERNRRVFFIKLSYLIRRSL